MTRASLACLSMLLVGVLCGCYGAVDAAHGAVRCPGTGWALQEGGGVDLSTCACFDSVRDCDPEDEQVCETHSTYSCKSVDDTAAACGKATSKLPDADKGGPIVFDPLLNEAADDCFKVNIDVRGDDIFTDADEFEMGENLYWATRDDEVLTEVRNLTITGRRNGEDLPDDWRLYEFEMCPAEDDDDISFGIAIRNAEGLLGKPGCTRYINFGS